ncbi:His-rich protein BRANT [Bradyrhizobium sp. TZ2]
MLKTISAALVAVSVLAAPAFAGSYGRTTHAPVIATGHMHSNMLNAHAWMGRHHHKHYRHYHHRRHHEHYRHYHRHH